MLVSRPGRTGRTDRPSSPRNSLNPLVWSVLLFLAAPSVAGEPARQEQKGPEIKLRSRTFVPEEGISAQLAQEIRRSDDPTAIHFMVQLYGPATKEAIDALGSVGIRLLLPLREQAWFASADRGTPLASPRIRYAGLLRPSDKIHPDLSTESIPARIQNPDGSIALHVMFHTDVPNTSGQEILREFGRNVERFGQGIFRGEILRNKLMELAARDEVMWIEPGRPNHELLMDVARQATRADAVQNATIQGSSTISYDLSGAGVQVGVFDSGVDPDHDDFLGRLIRTSGTGTHGTHVGGIIGASGFLSESRGGGSPFQFRGMAPGAEIASFVASISEFDYVEAIDDFGVEVTNNSFVQSVSCDYNTGARTLDEIVTGSAGRVIAICFGTGNNGAGRQYGDLVGYYSSFTSAKNTIAIGATNSDNNVRTNFSSMGPTFDGRLKPDVIAPGCRTSGGIFSTVPGDSYGFLCGTSMSGPATTGCIALLYEQYVKTYGVDLDTNPPLPATMKAVLIQTATDLINLNPGPGETNNPDTGVPVFYHEGPDYATGYGLVNVEAGARLIEERRLREFTTDGIVARRLTIQVPPGLNQLKITVAWDDPPGNPAESNTVPKLLNNLDATLKAPDNTIHFPWVVTPPPHEPYDGSLTGIDPIAPEDIVAATRGIDSVNNVEQILVENPAAGDWLLKVNPTSTVSAQSFGVASNVALDLARLDIQCDATVGANGRINGSATIQNFQNLDVPIRAEFSVLDCDQTPFAVQTIDNKTLPKNRTITRGFRPRLPDGLQTGCDLEIQIKVIHTGTGEVIAEANCTVQIP